MEIIQWICIYYYILITVPMKIKAVASLMLGVLFFKKKIFLSATMMNVENIELS